MPRDFAITPWSIAANPDISGTAVKLYIALRRHSWRTQGRVVASTAELRKDAGGISPATFWRAFAELERHGYSLDLRADRKTRNGRFAAQVLDGPTPDESSPESFKDERLDSDESFKNERLLARESFKDERLAENESFKNERLSLSEMKDSRPESFKFERPLLLENLDCSKTLPLPPAESRSVGRSDEDEEIEPFHSPIDPEPELNAKGRPIVPPPPRPRSRHPRPTEPDPTRTHIRNDLDQIDRVAKFAAHRWPGAPEVAMNVRSFGGADGALATWWGTDIEMAINKADRKDPFNPWGYARSILDNWWAQNGGQPKYPDVALADRLEVGDPDRPSALTYYNRDDDDL